MRASNDCALHCGAEKLSPIATIACRQGVTRAPDALGACGIAKGEPAPSSEHNTSRAALGKEQATMGFWGIIKQHTYSKRSAAGKMCAALERTDVPLSVGGVIEMTRPAVGQLYIYACTEMQYTCTSMYLRALS
jgi:hypothetical protein